MSTCSKISRNDKKKEKQKTFWISSSTSSLSLGLL
jgi:hypothetical protein